MKFFVFALIASALPFIQAETFSVATGDVKGQIRSLAGSIKQIKAVAQLKGHVQISAKCDEAQGHLSYAQNSFGLLSSGYLAAPWNARGSQHATDVRYRLSLCGNTLSWIFSQPEMRRFPQYKQPMSSCQSYYTNTQKACQKIWTWPTPSPRKQPGHGDSGYGDSGYGDSGYGGSDGYAPAPKPSQAHSHDGYGGYNRRSFSPDPKQCAPHETVCPIVFGSKDTECLDIKNEVASCGGCVSKNEGENCLDIVGADGVGCSEGSCIVLSVKEGFVLNKSGRPVRL